MSRFIRAVAFVSLAAVPATLTAQGSFEGVITARMAGPQGNSADVTYMIKGGQFRMDLSGRGMAMYMVRDAGKSGTMMVMPAQRMYMDISDAQMQGEASSRKAPDLKWTGKTETVAGHECEHLLVTDDDGTQFDICAARGMGTFQAMSNAMGRNRQATEAWQRLGRDVFPLKVQRVGKSDMSFEVTSIEKKSLDASLFAVPEGFTKMDMGRMGRPPA